VTPIVINAGEGNRMGLTRASITFVAIAIGASASAAEDLPPFVEGIDESAQYEIATLVDGLESPTCVAVRPGARPAGPFELYVAESGAGRVVRLATDAPEPATAAITGFPTRKFGPDGEYQAGPLGLVFLSRNRLVAGDGGLGVGEDLVRVYNLPDDGAELAFDAADHSAGPVPEGGRSTRGEGQFASLALTETSLFVVPRRGDERGWILKAVVDANRIAGLEPFVAANAIVGASTPSAVAVNPKPNYHYLVVAHMGEPSADRDSRIAMLSPVSGELALCLLTGLRDIVGLAYSPRGDLYAVDASWGEPAAGGVYRLEAAESEGRQSCRAVKIAAVVRPSSLAFASDGSLYVTAFGESAARASKPTGALLKITPKPETSPL
jgi:hypothetical protein